MGMARMCPIFQVVPSLANSIEEAKHLIETAIQMHLATMRADGDPIPEPSTVVDYVEVT